MSHESVRGADIPRRASLLAIRLYQLTLRGVLAPSCRFAPSCSEYAAQALTQHGARRGWILAARRLSRCHPWHPGGFDPVPDRRA